MTSLSRDNDSDDDNDEKNNVTMNASQPKLLT